MSQNEFTKKNARNGIPAQTILDGGLNVFGLQLLLESFTDIAGCDTTPLEFTYLGVKIRLQIANSPVPQDTVKGRTRGQGIAKPET